MKSKVLFFVIALFFLGCSPEDIQQSDAEGFEPQVFKLVAGLERQAEVLNVEFNADSVKQALLEASTEAEVKDIVREAGYSITRRYRDHQQRVQETIEIIVKAGRSAIEKALDWRLGEFQVLANDPYEDPQVRVDAQDAHIRLALNESSLLQSFEDRLREYLDENPPRVPQNGELIKCLRAACAAYERCYMLCEIPDPQCWYACETAFYRDLSACGIGHEGVKMPKEPEEGHPWGEQEEEEH